jgi:hypothetical protein
VSVAQTGRALVCGLYVYVPVRRETLRFLEILRHLFAHLGAEVVTQNSTHPYKKIRTFIDQVQASENLAHVSLPAGWEVMLWHIRLWNRKSPLFYWASVDVKRA